ncbi:MAG: permease-like cell division protein FtsX [Zoogloeaceae bacterium]|jgi:cell division transport system permease protein|nr:permease-like cell division protein FtsX [Zoogloeaceae bacterium]
MSTWLAQHGAAFRAALRRLAASPVNTLLSLLAIGIALALPAGGQMLVANVLQLARDSAPTPQISLFLDLDASKADGQSLLNRLDNHSGIKTFKFIPREDTLARMKSREGFADVIEALPKNPFPDTIIALPANDRPEAMEKLAAEFRKWPKVAQVQLDSDWARRLAALIKIGRLTVALLALLLGIGLIAITFNTIRLQVTTRRAEIELSRLLGATNAFIRRPFHYFGILLGLLGGMVAWLAVAAATWWLREPVAELASLYNIDLILQPLALPDSALLLAAAAGLGWLGASLSLRQHLAGEGNKGTD